MSILIGVDIGGTFTDAVVVDRGHVTTAKVSTTPDDPSRGMIEGIGAAPAPGWWRRVDSPTCSSSPARRGPTCTGRAGTGRARCQS
jgi:N-methylhydantoinase A/oxoprolinase/acetone carboxylase beta subunit